MKYEDLDLAYNDISSACKRLQEVLDSHDDPESLGYGLAQIREARRTLADLEYGYEQSMVVNMTDPRLEIAGVGVFEKKPGQKRTQWRHDELVTEIARAIQEEGLTNPKDIILKYRECVSTGAAKKPFVEYTGHELGEFCKEKEKPKTIKLTTPESAPRIAGF